MSGSSITVSGCLPHVQEGWMPLRGFNISLSMCLQSEMWSLQAWFKPHLEVVWNAIQIGFLQMHLRPDSARRTIATSNPETWKCRIHGALCKLVRRWRLWSHVCWQNIQTFTEIRSVSLQVSSRDWSHLLYQAVQMFTFCREDAHFNLGGLWGLICS